MENPLSRDKILLEDLSNIRMRDESPPPPMVAALGE